MRILQVFNRYLERGGEEMSVERISNVLSDRHQVFHCYFDSAMWAGKPTFLESVSHAAMMLYNRDSTRRFRSHLQACKPDLVLFHNIFPVGSVGLFYETRRAGVPLLQVIHNFRPFSVNGYLWSGDKMLPQGLHKNFIPEILAGSWQNSRVKTAVYGAILLSMHALGTFRDVDGWLAISDFMRRTFIDAGVDPLKVHLLRHSWEMLADPPGERGASDPPSLLFLGRLTEAKGIGTLLDAWKLASARVPHARLKIGGAGPLEERVKQQAAALPRCEYLGFVTGQEKIRLLGECTAMVIPSLWWEPLGLVSYEAYDHGKPVLAADGGGLAETVVRDQTGWLHTPGDAQQLAEHMVAALSSPQEAMRRGLAGREWLERNTRQKDWLDQFDAIATAVVAKSRLNRLKVCAYLADQNPGYDRSFGISRMSQIILEALQASGQVEMGAITSRSSQQPPETVAVNCRLPWGTRGKWIRLLTDHLHPLFFTAKSAKIHYFPKGYLPLLSMFCHPAIVTIHDTIIQYDADNYPAWRSRWEYLYWARILKHTLRHADRILTVSESGKRQIEAFLQRHKIPAKEIIVTYEPCAYEIFPQPVNPTKENQVIHLASVEPHKRTAHLIRWWHEAEARGMDLPMLHLIGSVPSEVESLVSSSRSIVKRPFLEDSALQAAYQSSKALILPSEIEGFGLPALEAYYLGTPVCYIRETSVEEILSVATDKGGFTLDCADSLFGALDEVVSMSHEEVRLCGLKLRDTYAAKKVAERMVKVFDEVTTR